MHNAIEGELGKTIESKLRSSTRVAVAVSCGGTEMLCTALLSLATFIPTDVTVTVNPKNVTHKVRAPRLPFARPPPVVQASSA